MRIFKLTIALLASLVTPTAAVYAQSIGLYGEPFAGALSGAENIPLIQGLSGQNCATSGGTVAPANCHNRQASISTIASFLGSNLPFTANGSGAVAQTFDKWAKRQCKTPSDFGAVGDGVTDDTVALTNALAASVALPAQVAKCLYLPGTRTYLATSAITLTMPAGSVGPVIYGDGGYNSKIKFSAGNLFLTSPTAMFYGSLRNFALTCNFAGPCIKFSASTTDAINGFDISGLVVNNTSTDPANMGVQFNGTYTSHINMTADCSGGNINEAPTSASGTGSIATLTWPLSGSNIAYFMPVGSKINVTGTGGYNTSGATVTASTATSVSYASAATGTPGSFGSILSIANGTGVQITAGNMNTGQIAAGSCNVGLNLTNNTNSIEGNVFTGNDLEVNAIGLLIDGSAAQGNTFIGGLYTAYSTQDFGLNASAGIGNKIVNPHFGGAGTLCEGASGIIMEATVTPTGLNCSGATFFGELIINTHKGYLGSNPFSLASGAFQANSTDTAGRITQTSATTNTLTFNSGFAGLPFCSVTPESAASTVEVVPTLTNFAVTFGTAQTQWSYQCWGN